MEQKYKDALEALNRADSYNDISVHLHDHIQTIRAALTEEAAQVEMVREDIGDALAYCEAKLRQSKAEGFKTIAVLNKHLETLIRAAQQNMGENK